MMRRKNILISTTRQWNPGDEFILFGTINILKTFIGDFNPIIFNRNPNIRPCDLRYNRLLTTGFHRNIEQLSFKGQGILLSHFRDRFCDNSFHDSLTGECIDYVVFAGTPEWEGARVKSLYRFIHKYEKKVIFLGIGYGGVRISEQDIYKRVWEKAELITTRDKKCELLLKQYGAKYVPCPALLSAQREKKIIKVDRVALVFSMSQTHIGNSVSEQTEDYLNNLYKELTKKYICSFVCHYIDEIELVRKKYPEAEVLYSFNAQDYFDIYRQFDLVVGARVHAIGICASMGIPGIMIAHDARSSTVQGFKARIINQKETNISKAMDIIADSVKQISVLNKELISHKRTTAETYNRLLMEETTLKNE